MGTEGLRSPENPMTRFEGAADLFLKDVARFEIALRSGGERSGVEETLLRTLIEKIQEEKKREHVPTN